MNSSSIARANLLSLQDPAGAWPYRPGGTLQAEPTALSALALLASGEDPATRVAAAAAADWLARLQRADGAVGVSEDAPAPGWPTPLALLVWQALATHDQQRARALAWLLASEGVHWTRAADEPVEHDTSIPGWSWSAGTHSWTEPTAMAILALERARAGDSPRVRDGRRLLRDRAVPQGGWNYGNRVVFGTPLRAHPSPTGLALLALATSGVAEDTAAPACAFLVQSLARVRAPLSLGWGLLGLTAWNACPAAADDWIGEAHDRHAARVGVTAELAYLILAAEGDRALSLLGVKLREGGAR